MPLSKHQLQAKPAVLQVYFAADSTSGKLSYNTRINVCTLGLFVTEEEAAMAYQREKARIQALEQVIQQPPPPADINSAPETKSTMMLGVDFSHPTPTIKQPKRVLLLIPISRVSELKHSITMMLKIGKPKITDLSL